MRTCSFENFQIENTVNLLFSLYYEIYELKYHKIQRLNICKVIGIHWWLYSAINKIQKIRIKGSFFQKKKERPM
jgi:hypothetical protein